MTYNWKVGLRSQPYMKSWNMIMDEDTPGGEHFWITAVYVNLNDDIPCLPHAYQEDQEAGRAVYVTGLPTDATPADCKWLFDTIAPVKQCPMLISLSSQHTFRWIIFESPSGAAMALAHAHGESLWDQRCRVARALKPGSPTLTNLSESHEHKHEHEPGREDRSEQDEEIVHGHPPPLPLSNSPSPTKRALSSTVVPITPSLPPIPIPTSPQEQRTLSTTQSTPTPAATRDSSAAEPPPVKAPEVPEVLEIPAAAPPKISWANVAGTSKPEERIIDLHPKPARLKPIGPTPSISYVRNVDAYAEPLEDQKRVVLLLNLPNNLTIRDISDAVKEGPLVKIVLAQNDDDKSRYAGIIFQRAYEAAAFYEVLQRERKYSRPDRFRFIVDAVMGDPFPMNEEVKAMSPPLLATRRLTLVKARFFFMFKEEMLQRFCEKLVGLDNIQLIWLYNGGNATVVFADVMSAIRVKTELDRKSASAGKPDGESEIWAGLQVSFSKDPCVVPLELKTALYE